MSKVETDTPEAPPGRRLRRLLLVTASFFPEFYGGAERQALILAHALARRGVHVTLAHPTLQDGLPGREATDYGEVRRVRVKHFPANGGRHIGSFLSWTTRVRAWLAREGGSFDAIYVFHARLHLMGPLLGGLAAGRPVFVKLGGGGTSSDFLALEAKRYLYGAFAARFAAGRVSGWVANSREIEGDLAGRGVPAERVFAFPNGVVSPGLDAVAAALDRRRGTRFIYTGRVQSEKSPLTLVEALALCVEGGADVSLEIVGDGPQGAEVAARVAALGIGERVTLTGRVDAVYPHLLAADYFLSASQVEGQSNALLEGLSAGLIPVCIGASGVADTFAAGREGFTADDPSPAALARAMGRALALTPGQRRAVSLGNAERAARDLSIDAIAGRTIAAIESVLRP